ncbi:MAG: efflux RND transporter periplasmic adaptor subunit [Sphingomonas sp.]|uniref:efflux RND transporter periplasmic adaptor subunit n=1 Tax=Sphingomonas sp. TaxID=28214 RepID=UPI003F7D6C7C
MTDSLQDLPIRETPAEVVAEESVPHAPTASPAPAAPTPLAPEPAKSNTRRRLLVLVTLVIVIAALIYAIWALFLVGPSQSTDDAYVGGDTIAITARDPGTVLGLYADDTQRVAAGQTLITLDPATADVDLAAAAAQLGRAVRGVRGDFSQVNSAQAELNQAQAELSRSRNDLARRQRAAGEGAVSGEEVAHAADSVKTATAAVALAQSKVAEANTQVQGTDIRSNPAVLAAIADYRRAAIRRSHMTVTTPVAGIVAQRRVQIGQQIAAGTPLMAVVPLDRVWIDANFRETQLADIRIGQPVTITTDTYGGKVVYHGKIAGLGAGSGNAFALLPPQNASGNWIKVVQRVPVRIALDPRELREHPLRIGLSVDARVDTANTSGPVLGGQSAQPYAPQASDVGGDAVDAQINAIIAANAGRAG